jgi:hypothetical protein
LVCLLPGHGDADELFGVDQVVVVVFAQVDLHEVDLAVEPAAIAGVVAKAARLARIYRIFGETVCELLIFPAGGCPGRKRPQRSTCVPKINSAALLADQV